MQDLIIPKEILNKYRSLIRYCSDKTTPKEKKEIKKAFETAYLAHIGIKI